VAPTVFVPLRYEVRVTNSSFFVDDFSVAEKLVSVSNRITTCSGFKLLVKVKPGLPHSERKVKAVMVKRYNAGLYAIDLTHFYKDGDHTDVGVALSRPSLILVVLKIIQDDFSDVAGLHLCDNKL
jgi:hypothetical protein